MKTIIALILLCIATTTYASNTFEQSYKNARTPIQKIRVLWQELKNKDAIIKDRDTTIKKKDADIELLLGQEGSVNKDLRDTVRMLRTSNEDKDREIQRLMGSSQRVEQAVIQQPTPTPQVVATPIISKPMKAILTVEINGKVTTFETDLTPVMTGEQNARERALTEISGQIGSALFNAVVGSQK